MQFRLEHIERVKTYAPRVGHFVLDIDCGSHLWTPSAVPSDQRGVRVLQAPLNRADFDAIVAGREPVVLQGMMFGSCLERWDAHYLASKCQRPVLVHVCTDKAMSFNDRNWEFRTIPFSELVERIADSSVEPEQRRHNPFLSRDEGYYMRSLADDARRDVANFFTDYNELSADFCPESHLIGDRHFSSVLRLQSADNELWTHYDITDNLLYQIRGRKRVTLFAPELVNQLYIDTSSSQGRNSSRTTILQSNSFIQ